MYSYQSFVFKIIINLFHHVPFDDISRMRFVKHYRLLAFTIVHDFLSSAWRHIVAILQWLYTIFPSHLAALKWNMGKWEPEMLISGRIPVTFLKCVKYWRFWDSFAVGGSSLRCPAPLFKSPISPISPPSVRYRGGCVSVYILYTIFDVHVLHTSVGNIVRYSAIWP